VERDTFLYRFRRRCQILAHAFLPDEFLSGLYCRVVLCKRLNLREPRTFNEKIQWLKLYYYPRTPLIVQATDKYTVRDYIREKGYADRAVPLLGVWDKAEKIDWNSLPDSFVLKCSHGCAYNIVVPDKSKLDRRAAARQLNAWLREDFGAFNIEPHYSAIRHRRIICEEYLGENLTDYKFFCFNGRPEYIYVSKDLIHDRQAQIGFFYLDGRKMPLHRDDYTDIPEVELPPFFPEMLRAAQTLCRDFPFVRVDFFLANNTWYFAELTFTPGAGMMPFNPESCDLEWGNMLDLDAIRKNT
jgi:hypothetical protein